MNKFFSATKNCSKLAVHATTNRYSSFCSAEAVSSLLPLAEHCGLSVLAREGLAPANVESYAPHHAWGAVLPLTLTLLRVLALKSSTAGRTNKINTAKIRYLPTRSRLHSLSGDEKMGFGPNSLDFFLDHGKRVTKSKLVEPKMASKYRLFEVLADFRFLFVRKLINKSSSVTTNYRTTNLNLFTYRTHNWRMTI